MTNEEKTKELADFLYFKLSHIDYNTLTKKFLEMAEWKDQQFQTAINKTMKYLEKNLQLSEAESEHIRNIFKQSLI